MLADPVARVYSEALFQIAAEQKAVEDYAQELREFRDLGLEDELVDLFFASPVLEPGVKQEVLRKAVDGRMSPTVVDFLCLLLQKRRGGAYRSIVEAYEALADEHAGRTRVSVQTAVPLAEELRREIESVLRSSLQQEVVMEPEVEPSIMGGAVIAVGDTVYDGSIRRRLNDFRKQVMRSGGYENQG